MFLFHFSADKQRRVPAYVVLDLGGFVLFVAGSGKGAGLFLFLLVPGGRGRI